ncbi:MAG: glutathione S-transferase N-terminal domain-containing protein [Bradyrhizobium sp.]
MIEGRYRLIGSTASPYAIKLRALLRYRRIPFDWVIMTKALRKQTEHLRPNLIPVLQYPDGTFRGETTTLAYDLENRYRDRSVVPEDKAVAFVCDLLEDLADEWAVKPLFLYRWWDPEDQAMSPDGRPKNGPSLTLSRGALKKSNISASGRFPGCQFSARRLRTSPCWKQATTGFLPRSSLTSA